MLFSPIFIFRVQENAKGVNQEVYTWKPRSLSSRRDETDKLIRVEHETGKR